MALDFGTGDGGYVQATARRRPDTLVIGVDANADNLRAASLRAAAKPARGGLGNALFGRVALADAPGELAGLADELTVLLPWGGLLAAAAGGAGLARLAELCRPGAHVRVVFGYGAADAGGTAGLALPDGGTPGFAAGVCAAYAAAGIAVALRPLPLAELRALPTTWAKKLAFGGRERRFWEVAGVVGGPRAVVGG